MRPLRDHIGAPSPWASDSVSPVSAVRQHEFMTIKPDALLSKKFQAGHPPCGSSANQYLLVPYQSQVSAELSMLHGTIGGDGCPEDNQLVTDKCLGSCSEQTVTPRIRAKQNRTLGQSY